MKLFILRDSNNILNPSSVRSQFPSLRWMQFYKFEIDFDIEFIPWSPKGLFLRSSLSRLEDERRIHLIILADKVCIPPIERSILFSDSS